MKIEIISSNHVVLHHGWTEMGQGVNTMAVQFLSEETGMDPNIIEVHVDTSKEAKSGMTTASRATSFFHFHCPTSGLTPSNSYLMVGLSAAFQNPFQ